MEKILIKLSIALSWADLKIKNEDDFMAAAEQIEDDMAEEKIDIDEAVNNWIKNTLENCPEYFN